MRYSNRSFLAAVALVASLSLAGCFSESNTSRPNAQAGIKLYEMSDSAEVVNQIGHNVILATYLDLDAKIKALNAACVTLSTSPTAGNLLTAQTAWKVARVPWESTESFLIGPVDALGIDPQMDSWPLAVADLQSVLATQPNITAEGLHQLDTNLRGFHTAEFLLFGDGVNTNNKDISAFRASEFNYLISVTGLMAEHTSQLVTAWTQHFDPEDANSPAFIDVFTLRSTRQQTGFSNLAQVLQTIIQDGMVGIAGEVGDSKLATPLGGDIASANPSLVESQFSWNSLVDFQNNVESIVHLYTGDYGGKVGAGIDELVRQSNPELDKQIIATLEESKRKIAAIAGADGQMPFTRAIKDPEGRARVQIAIDQMHVLHALLQDQLANLAK